MLIGYKCKHCGFRFKCEDLCNTCPRCGYWFDKRAGLPILVQNNEEWVHMIKSNFDESDYTPVRLVLNSDRKLSFAEYEEENGEEPSQASKTQRAMEILEVMLGESGQAAVSEIHAVMADEDISDKTAQRAQRRV